MSPRICWMHFANGFFLFRHLWADHPRRVRHKLSLHPIHFTIILSVHSVSTSQIIRKCMPLIILTNGFWTNWRNHTMIWHTRPRQPSLPPQQDGHTPNKRNRHRTKRKKRSKINMRVGSFIRICFTFTSSFTIHFILLVHISFVFFFYFYIFLSQSCHLLRCLQMCRHGSVMSSGRIHEVSTRLLGGWRRVGTTSRPCILFSLLFSVSFVFFFSVFLWQELSVRTKWQTTNQQEFYLNKPVNWWKWCARCLNVK